MTICGQISSVPFQEAQKKTESSQKKYHRKKSFAFHLEQDEFTQRSLALLTPTNGRTPFRHIGRLAEAGSSYPPYPPGRLLVVAPNVLTREGKHRAKRILLRVNVVPWCSIAMCQYIVYVSTA